MNRKKPKGPGELEIPVKAPVKPLILHLGAVLTIQGSRELKEMLVSSLQNADRVIINLEKAGEVDITLLQLLCSAHRTALKENKMLEIAENYPEELIRLAEQAGFLRSKGCPFDTRRSCLWRKETSPV